DGAVFFHPGDCLDTVPEGVDLVAVPAHGPWCAMKETIDFVRALGAPQGFLIHDGLINERGWALTFARLNEMTGTRFTDRRGGDPVVL
ncbi:MAG: MBL fold metallo-hydrolase, partial [Propionibacteriaceae bacterium]|nr:MBL fold metallo-hydrolase [Propionibacteriaceae bacterium]